MQINARVIQDTLYLSLCGELDEHSSSYVRKALDKHLTNTLCKQVILDLNELTFMDSTGIGVMIGRYKKMRERNVPIFVSNPSVHIDKIFKMTAMYEIMPKIN